MLKQSPASRLRPCLSPLLLGTLACLALAEVLGPRAFSLRDETFCFHQALIFRNSGPLAIAWGDGNILKFLQFTLFSLSGWWRAMHVPVLLAVTAQGWALYSIGCRLGGPRVAQGALLAALVSATALLQARSLLSFAILPGLLAVALDLILRGGWLAFIGGAFFACGFLDYEATVFALPGLAALLLFEARLDRRDKARALVGLGLGLLLVLWLCRDSLGEWWLQRMAYNLPSQVAAGQSRAGRLLAWFIGGDAEAYLGVSGHGSFPYWALPLALFGLLLQFRARPWLWLWIAGGLTAMLPGSAKLEPQRAFILIIPLSLATGFAWRWLWQRARHRALLAWALLLLPVLGLALEQRAFERSVLAGQAVYGRSQAWLQLGRDPAFHGQIDAALMPIGSAWEALNGTPPQAALAPWVWVPDDLALDLPAMKVEQRALQDAQGKFTGDLLLALPARDPLRQDLAALRLFWGRQPRLKRPMVAGYRRTLIEKRVRTPIARAVLWKLLFEAGIQSDALTVDDLRRFESEPFHSELLYRAILVPSWPKDLRLSYCLLTLMKNRCGIDKLNDQERQLLQVPWQAIPVSPQAPAWPQPRS